MTVKEIMLPNEAKKKLAEDFGVSGVTLWKALKYETSEGKSNLLRKAALERGGRVYDGTPSPESWSPNCETTHQTAESTMTQVFSDRVKLIVDRKNDKVAVFIDGIPKVTGTASGMSVSELMQLQMQAEEAAAQLKQNEL